MHLKILIGVLTLGLALASPKTKPAAKASPQDYSGGQSPYYPFGTNNIGQSYAAQPFPGAQPSGDYSVSGGTSNYGNFPGNPNGVPLYPQTLAGNYYQQSQPIPVPVAYSNAPLENILQSANHYGAARLWPKNAVSPNRSPSTSLPSSPQIYYPSSTPSPVDYQSTGNYVNPPFAGNFQSPVSTPAPAQAQYPQPIPVPVKVGSRNSFQPEITNYNTPPPPNVPFPASTPTSYLANYQQQSTPAPVQSYHQATAAPYAAYQQQSSSAPYVAQYQQPSVSPYQANYQQQSTPAPVQSYQQSNAAPYEAYQQQALSAPYVAQYQQPSVSPYQVNYQQQSTPAPAQSYQPPTAASYSAYQQKASSAPYVAQYQQPSVSPYQVNYQQQSTPTPVQSYQPPTAASYSAYQQQASNAPYVAQYQQPSISPYQVNYQQQPAPGPYQPNYSQQPSPGLYQVNYQQQPGPSPYQLNYQQQPYPASQQGPAGSSYPQYQTPTGASYLANYQQPSFSPSLTNYQRIPVPVAYPQNQIQPQPTKPTYVSTTTSVPDKSQSITSTPASQTVSIREKSFFPVPTTPSPTSKPTATIIKTEYNAGAVSPQYNHIPSHSTTSPLAYAVNAYLPQTVGNTSNGLSYAPTNSVHGYSGYSPSTEVSHVSYNGLGASYSY